MSTHMHIDLQLKAMELLLQWLDSLRWDSPLLECLSVRDLQPFVFSQTAAGVTAVKMKRKHLSDTSYKEITNIVTADKYMVLRWRPKYMRPVNYCCPSSIWATAANVKPYLHHLVDGWWECDREMEREWCTEGRQISMQLKTNLISSLALIHKCCWQIIIYQIKSWMEKEGRDW